jgi:hypothetical protein
VDLGTDKSLMARTYRHGLPLSVSTHAANHHEVRLVQLRDSDPLDAELRKDGIEMIAPHRKAAHARSAKVKPLHAALAR